MSYIRWSKESDVYVYVANKHIIATPYNLSVIKICFFDKSKSVDSEIECKSPEDAMEKLREMISIGYKVPNEVFKNLEKDIEWFKTQKIRKKK